METKNIILVAVVVILAIAIRIVRSKKGGGFKKTKRYDSGPTEDDYEPYSGK